MKTTVLRIIKLGASATDSATNLPGMITHAYVGLDKRVQYCFQPQGLNPEDGQPVKRLWMVPERLESARVFEEIKLPLDVLGTHVTDSASGFAGTAIGLIYHISGCVHVAVQPTGRNSRTGAVIEDCEFDIRRLEGSALQAMTEKERAEDQAERPSPSHAPRSTPRLPS